MSSNFSPDVPPIISQLKICKVKGVHRRKNKVTTFSKSYVAMKKPGSSGLQLVGSTSWPSDLTFLVRNAFPDSNLYAPRLVAKSEMLSFVKF